MPPQDLAELERALTLCCQELAALLEEPDPVPSPVPVPATMGPAAVDNLRWRPLSLLPLPGLDTIISVVKPPITIIIALLNLIKALLEALAAILIGLLDAFRAILMAAIALLTDIINDLLNTGAYMYVDVPGLTPTEVTLAETGIIFDPVDQWTAGQELKPPPVTPDGYARWATRFQQSFDDPGDPHRPIVTAGAPIQAVFIVFAAPSLDPLRQLMYLLGKLFNIDSFVAAFEKYQPGNPDPRRTRARAMKGVKPDWDSIKLVDILPQLKGLYALPEALRGLLASVDGLSGLIRALAAAMNEKAQTLMKLAEALQAILDLLEALKSIGFYILPVSTTGGSAALAQAFQAAADRPPGGYIGGVCFLAAGPNLAKAAMLWELLGASTAMDVLEGELSVTDALAQSTLGSVIEQNADKVIDEADKFGSTVKAESQAFEDALVNAPDTFYGELGAAKDQVLENLASSASEAVNLLESTRETLGYSDEQIARGVDSVKQAQRPGARSLALGLASRPQAPPPPPDDDEEVGS